MDRWTDAKKKNVNSAHGLGGGSVMDRWTDDRRTEKKYCSRTPLP